MVVSPENQICSSPQLCQDSLHSTSLHHSSFSMSNKPKPLCGVVFWFRGIFFFFSDFWVWVFKKWVWFLRFFFFGQILFLLGQILLLLRGFGSPWGWLIWVFVGLVANSSSSSWICFFFFMDLGLLGWLWIFLLLRGGI